MRISTQQQYLRSIDQMQNKQSEIANLQNQISTGKRLLKPSDDPVAAAQVVKLERELAQYEKFDYNINVTQRRLELEDSILDDINTATDRMRELTIQAGGVTLNDQDRLSISKELTQLTQYVAGLMNTQDSEGEYLFAGSKGTTKPYEALANGRYQYNGDDGQRSIQVGAELYVPSNDSGKYLFDAVDDRLKIELTGQAVYNAELAASEPFIRVAEFQTLAAETQFSEATQGLGDITLTVTGTAPAFQYSVVDSGGNPVKDTDGNDITNVPAGDLSTTPLEVNLLGMSLELHEPADMTANSITINVAAEKKTLLDVAADLAEVLANPVKSNADRGALSEAIATGLEQFSQAADRNVEARATLGSRLKTLENISSSNLDFELFTKKALSTLEDANMAEVISKFKLEEATLQAAQATFGRVSQLSLFNYLR